MRWRTRDQDDDFEEPDFYYENEDPYDAPYVVIEKRDAGVGLLLLGLALGAGAALIFAPQSGEETRRGIARSARRVQRTPRNLWGMSAETSPTSSVKSAPASRSESRRHSTRSTTSGVE